MPINTGYPREERSDLAYAEYSNPEYLHEAIAPTFKVAQTSGTMYYQPVNADTAAITGRQSLGAITPTAAASASRPFTASEILKRAEMGVSEVEQCYADLLRAQLALARIGKRSVDGAIETALATALIGGEVNEDVSASNSIPEDVEALAYELFDIAPGGVGLILPAPVFSRLKANANILERMKATGVAIGEGGDPRKITEAQMAAIMGVSRVFIANTRIWTPVAAGTGALVALPNGELSPREEVQFARTVVYDTGEEDGFPFTCESWFDNQNLGHAVDTRANAQVLVLNSGLKKSIKFF
jgi:hypothetical protein